MIFKKRKTRPGIEAEPATRIEPFPGAGKAKSSPLKNRFGEKAAKLNDNPGLEEEPLTRDAVFDTPAQSFSRAEDPQVGILVIIDGPGRGYSAPLTYGENTVGRGSGMTVRLDFGDEDLLETPHAVIAYDQDKRTFHIKPGDEANDVKMGAATVSARGRKLKHQDKIRLGNTVLLFAAICGDGFDWHADAPLAQD